MQSKSTSNMRVLTLTFISIALCVSGTALAQGIEGGRSGTSTADNPFLRGHDEASKSKAAKTIVKVSDKDANFVSRAMAGGEEEVENGKMALSRAQSAEVKTVASRMVQDHTKANGELLALAKKKGIAVTTGTIKAQQLNANGFDKAYLKMLEQGHKMIIAEFEREAKNGGDPDLKAWATKTLPTLREHLAMVRNGLKQVK